MTKTQITTHQVLRGAAGFGAGSLIALGSKYNEWSALIFGILLAAALVADLLVEYRATHPRLQSYSVLFTDPRTAQNQSFTLTASSKTEAIDRAMVLRDSIDRWLVIMKVEETKAKQPQV